MSNITTKLLKKLNMSEELFQKLSILNVERLIANGFYNPEKVKADGFQDNVRKYLKGKK